MKTLVLISVGSEILSAELSDFPVGGPIEGRNYEFEGKLYRIVEITETLGVRGLLGNKLSGDQRLLNFADAVCKGDEAMKQAFMKPKKVGKDGPEDVRSSGGIIIGSTAEAKPGLSTPYDHLIFVKTVPADTKSEQLRMPRALRLQESDLAPAGGAQSLLGADSETQPQS